MGKGLQVDIGKFVTPAGAEVIETKDNWNYSRGLLFSYAIPYYHFGMRAKYAFNDKYALTGFFVNGWNNVVDNNSGKDLRRQLRLESEQEIRDHARTTWSVPEEQQFEQRMCANSATRSSPIRPPASCHSS